MVAVEVDAPARTCYELWNNWERLVDFLDLVAQIGLDPNEPDLGLFQCFYRWGRLPIMEIVFLARKVEAEQDKYIKFESIWGMPAMGEVSFIPADNGRSTTVIFKFEHQIPHLLLDLKIGRFGIETHLRQILTENMAEFKHVAESGEGFSGTLDRFEQEEGEDSSITSSSSSGSTARQRRAIPPTPAGSRAGSAGPSSSGRASSRQPAGQQSAAGAAPPSGSGRKSASPAKDAAAGSSGAGAAGAGKRGRPARAVSPATS